VPQQPSSGRLAIGSKFVQFVLSLHNPKNQGHGVHSDVAEHWNHEKQKPHAGYHIVKRHSGRSNLGSMLE